MLSNGDLTQIESLKRTDIFDFFEHLKIFEEKQEAEISRIEKLKNKSIKKGGKKK